MLASWALGRQRLCLERRLLAQRELDGRPVAALVEDRLLLGAPQLVLVGGERAALLLQRGALPQHRQTLVRLKREELNEGLLTVKRLSWFPTHKHPDEQAEI